jgi:hypothetical protein
MLICIRLFFLLLMLAPLQAFAGWTAFLPSHVPAHFFAVSKGKDILYKMSGMSAVKEYPCIHGRAEGDKQVQGDLKTPEGIYFITRKVNQKLDFMEYGPHAFALNYPNPVDRLRGKTGGGIWLHSKGQPIKGIQTRGCVAVEQEDITALVPDLPAGTPVLIAQDLSGKPFSQGSEVSSGAIKEEETAPAVSKAEEEVLSLTNQWLERASKKDGAIFSMYDEVQWKKANKAAFSVFAAAKREAFARAEGEITGSNICLLEGPGYWASFFLMQYGHGGSSWQGIKILYWLPDSAGTYRIIGDFTAAETLIPAKH